MSEHTEGKIEAYTEESLSGWFALRQITDDGLNHEIGSGYGGLFEPDARRLAAVWNACEGMATEEIEALHGNGSLGNLMCSRDQLNAARALLREVANMGVMIRLCDNDDRILEGKIREYLDACDTLEGKC